MPAATDTDAIRVGARAGLPEDVLDVEYVTEGSNDVYLIETSAENYVVKFNTYTYSDMFRTEVAVTDFLHDTIELPTPEVYGYDASRTNADVPYYVMEYLPGEQATPLTVDYDSHLVTEIGTAIATFGDAPGDDIDADAYGLLHRDLNSTGLHAETKTWREYFCDFVEGVVDHATDVGHIELVSEYREPLLDALHTNADAIPEHPSKGIVLDDFRLENLLVDPDDSGTITGVLDLERATLGDSAFTLVNTEHLLGRDLDTAQRQRLRTDLETGFGETISEDTRFVYRLGVVARELRAFNFWYRDEAAATRENHTSRLRNTLGDLLG